MGLLDTSLQIGRSAIMAHSLALDVTGNNIANSTTEGYARRAVDLRSMRGIRTTQGPYLGLGVEAASILRLSDIYLEQRLRDARSGLESFKTQDEALARLEGVFNELSDNDLSSAINDFYTALNELQSRPEERSVRRAVIESAVTLTENVGLLRTKMDALRKDIDSEVVAAVDIINGITAELAQLNVEIARIEGGGATGGGATSLRDRRDVLLGQLADLLQVRVIHQDNGTISVFAGSDPLVMLDRSFELTVETRVDRDVRGL
jgi:flagellar hook-associated protein 1 FlgK